MKLTPTLLTCVALLAACSSGPPTPDWQMNAQDSIQRYEAAYLNGDAAIEAAEWQRAREQIARSGNIELIARTELIRCAARVASLVFEECAGFERLGADGNAAQRAYAAYLAGRIQPADVALLPARHRAVAAAVTDTATAAAVQGIADPLSTLVAAGVLLRAGHGSPALLALAADTASKQGWRRPLLAWLGAQAMLAEQAGATAEAQRIRRRIDLVQGTPGR